MVTLPYIGERMIIGYFRSKSVKVKRRRIREGIRRVDPEGLTDRRNKLHHRITRRIYSVPRPHFLWHIDGNHKLIRWGLVIHCAIDGHSRTCLYLKCSENNRSDTVLTLFENAIINYGVIPKHVRSDYGTENVKVWEAMNNLVEDDSYHPMLLGSSVHNQRVERFNRDINRNIRNKFAPILYSLENLGILDLSCELDVFALHYVFIPRVNAALTCLANTHNSHSIRTENNRTPNQIFSAHGYTPANHVGNDNIQELLHFERAEDKRILTDYYLNHLVHNVPSQTDDRNEGRTVYEAVREYIHLYASGD